MMADHARRQGWRGLTAEGHEGTFQGDENVPDHCSSSAYMTTYL